MLLSVGADTKDLSSRLDSCLSTQPIKKESEESSRVEIVHVSHNKVKQKEGLMSFRKEL